MAWATAGGKLPIPSFLLHFLVYPSFPMLVPFPSSSSFCQTGCCEPIIRHLQCQLLPSQS